MLYQINDKWDINLPLERGEFHRLHKDWERDTIESLFKNINPGDVVIDVGTELGDYATLFALWGAKVVCIEPQPKYWPIIKKHFAMNDVKPLACFAGFASNVNEANPALADFEIGNDKLWPKCAKAKYEEWNGFRNVIETGISTPQLRIDQVVQEYRLSSVAVMTIDVEGAEFEVLKGAVTTLNLYKPLVYVSIHPAMLMNDYGNTPEEIFAFMAEQGYEHKFIAQDHETHEVFYTSPKRLK